MQGRFLLTAQKPGKTAPKGLFTLQPKSYQTPRDWLTVAFISPAAKQPLGRQLTADVFAKTPRGLNNYSGRGTVSTGIHARETPY